VLYLATALGVGIAVSRRRSTRNQDAASAG
jgi:hypothetical protein